MHGGVRTDVVGSSADIGPSTGPTSSGVFIPLDQSAPTSTEALPKDLAKLLDDIKLKDDAIAQL